MGREMVSIIMPAYNAENYLTRSIQSIQAQTYDNWELLIVDDGSSDRTREVAAAFSQKDERVKLLCNQHGGTARARNTALDVAQGEYISFIDADDAYHPFYLQRLVEAMEKDHSDISICGMFEGVDYEGFLRAALQDGATCIDMETAFSRMYDQDWGIMISPCNKLYKSELFSDLRFPDGRYFEDLFTINRAIYKCCTLTVLDAALYFYHFTPNSSSKTARSTELLDRECAVRSHWEFFLQNGRKDLAYQAISFYLARLVDSYYRIQSSDRPEDCAIIRKLFIRTYRKYWRKVTASPERTEIIEYYRHPTLRTIRTIVRRDGIVKTATRFIRKRLGKKK
jgi:glycosyltransferase involved in cell wall biosynthesis